MRARLGRGDITPRVGESEKEDKIRESSWKVTLAKVT